MPVILATGGSDQEDRSSKPAQANSSQDPISKNKTKQKNQHRTGAYGVSQVVECLPTKYDALSSNPSTAKEKERKKDREANQDWPKQV
jgi:hypothetical protein